MLRYSVCYSLAAAFFLFIVPGKLKAGFEYTPNCQEAQQQAFNLRTLDARATLRDEKHANPDNAYVIYLEQYCDIIDLIATDEEERYENLMDAYPARFEEMDRLVASRKAEVYAKIGIKE